VNDEDLGENSSGNEVPMSDDSEEQGRGRNDQLNSSFNVFGFNDELNGMDDKLVVTNPLDN